MRFELTILGSGSALPSNLRNTTAQVLNVLERFFLIDCGEGCQLQLRKKSISFAKIDHIFISHLHGDHYFGLFGLLSTLNLLGRTQQLHIYSHEDLFPILENVLNNDSEKWLYPIKKHNLSITQKEILFEDNKVKVSSFPLRHTIPTCGFLFEEKPRPRKIKKEIVKQMEFTIKELNHLKNGFDIERDGAIFNNTDLTIAPLPARRYAFVTDTLKCSSIIPIIQNVDILYHESTFLHTDLPAARQTCHSTALQAAEIAAAANVQKLLLGHISGRYKNCKEIELEAKSVFDNSCVVADGERFCI